MWQVIEVEHDGLHRFAITSKWLNFCYVGAGRFAKCNQDRHNAFLYTYKEYAQFGADALNLEWTGYLLIAGLVLGSIAAVFLVVLLR